MEFGGMILPEPKGDGAEVVAKKLEVICATCPGIVSREQFAIGVLTAANEVPQCTRLSVATAAFNCASLGLIPGSALGHAYFIPFSAKGGKKICQLIVGYQGYLELAYRSDFLTGVHAQVVCADEEYRIWVDDGPHITHEMTLDRNPNRENIIGAYCVYKTRRGFEGLSFVTSTDLKAVDTGRNVWESNYPAMCKKTPIRRAAKEWKKTPELARAVLLDELAEDRSEEQPALVSMDAGEGPKADPGLVLDYQAMQYEDEECDE